jgi:hypothetical protein
MWVQPGANRPELSNLSQPMFVLARAVRGLLQKLSTIPDWAADVFVIVLLTYSAAASVWEASQRPFWFDELFSVLIAALPTFGHVLDALGNAADTSGPMFYAVQRLTSGLSANDEIGHRITSIASTTLAYGLVYLIARRDLGGVPGCISVLVLHLSQLYHGYSVEARAYGLMVMFVCLAMAAWQRAESRFAAVWLAAAGALAVATHYYAIFALAAIGVSELVYVLRARRFRVGVWLALLSPPAMLLTLWPFLHSLRTYYGDNYWARPSLGKALQSYDTMLSIGQVGSGFGLALALGVALLLLFAIVWEHSDTWRPQLPAPEMLVLIMTLLATPFVAVAAAMVMNGGFTERYALGVLPGVGLAIGYVAWALQRRKQAWVLLALVCTFASHELAFWATGGAFYGTRQWNRINSEQKLIAGAAEYALPVVVSNGHDLLPLFYYGTGAAKGSVLTLIDPEAAVRYTGTDSIDLDLRALSQHVDVPVRDFERFRNDHGRFLLLTAPGQGNWWPNRLMDDGYRLTVVSQADAYVLYHAAAPDTKLSAD